MDEKKTCDQCKKEVDAAGSVVFTPSTESAQEKRLCMSCFENMNAEASA
ncbi:hypothetical protein K8R03_04500 [Candidatus Kaiserbacteria bacterium]|nr:hypothetical protein [Candidatus Kaiserbacteria bacterium]